MKKFMKLLMEIGHAVAEWQSLAQKSYDVMD
jgi:hypothetical protein